MAEGFSALHQLPPKEAVEHELTLGKLPLRRLGKPEEVANVILFLAVAAFCSDYIANILEQRQRLFIQPGPLHLTRRQDLLDIQLAPADLSIYER